MQSQAPQALTHTFTANGTPMKPAAEPTVAEICDRYLQFAAAQNQSPRAHAERMRVIRLFCADVGSRTCGTVTGADLLDWLQSHPTWKSDWTRARVITTIQRPFNWAVRVGLLRANPLAHVPLPAGDPGQPMAGREYQALLRHSGPEWRRLVVFARFTGCRPGEFCGLEWTHLDREMQTVTLWRHKTARTRKVKRPRVILLHPVARRLIEWIRRQQLESDFVFLNSKGRPWIATAISYHVVKARQAAGIREDCTLYGLRHRFGTQAILNRVDVFTLAQLMGHNDTKTTARYVHLAGETEHLRDAVERATDWKKNGN